jgi:hypothetical protein
MGRIEGGFLDRSAITVSASHSDDSTLPQFALSALPQTNFESHDLPGHWLEYAFAGVTVRPLRYLIRSANSDHLKSWVLEGRRPDSDWIELDRRDDVDDLNGSSLSATFSVSHPETVDFVRIRQSGPNHSGSDSLALSQFEIFGPITGLPLGGGRKLDSVILASFPPLFEDLDGSRFVLLYRAGRDGDTPADFHRLCDGHPNTLTVIRSTGGWIFGGYTPATWSIQGGSVADPSGESFLFTLVNPRGAEPMKFPIRQDRTEFAIYCARECGPSFGGAGAMCDLRITYRGRSHTQAFGRAYEVGDYSEEFLTGAPNFVHEEIEIFEVM